MEEYQYDLLASLDDSGETGNKAFEASTTNRQVLAPLAVAKEVCSHRHLQTKKDAGDFKESKKDLFRNERKYGSRI